MSGYYYYGYYSTNGIRAKAIPRKRNTPKKKAAKKAVPKAIKG